MGKEQDLLPNVNPQFFSSPHAWETEQKTEETEQVSHVQSARQNERKSSRKHHEKHQKSGNNSIGLAPATPCTDEGSAEEEEVANPTTAANDKVQDLRSLITPKKKEFKIDRSRVQHGDYQSGDKPSTSNNHTKPSSPPSKPSASSNNAAAPPSKPSASPPSKKKFHLTKRKDQIENQETSELPLGMDKISLDDTNQKSNQQTQPPVKKKNILEVSGNWDEIGSDEVFDYAPIKWK